MTLSFVIRFFSISTFQVNNLDYLLAKNVQSKSRRKNDSSLFLQLNIIALESTSSATHSQIARGPFYASKTS